MFRTEQIQSVFLHYFASGRSETQEKRTAFVEMSCSTSWRIVFSKSFLSFFLEFYSGDKPDKY